jgi:hypothetical protein
MRSPFGLRSGISRWHELMGGGFSPAVLFANNEPGVWYDPSDLSTLFQDPAGTTPVTTPGQTVALMLDKSKGLTLGPELVTNGGFDDGSTGWTNFQDGGVHTWDYSAGVLVFSRGSTGGAGALQSFSVSPNTNYILSGDALSVTGDGTTANFAVWNGGVFPTVLISNVISESGTTGSLIFNSGSNTSVNLYVQCARSTTITIDNISVKELPGFHATQPTTSWCPRYGIVPAGGRRNLLERTEEFDNAYWTENRTVVTTNATSAPDGTITADRLRANGLNYYLRFNEGTSTPATASIYVKKDTSDYAVLSVGGTLRYIALFDLVNGTLVDSSDTTATSIEAVGDGWYRISISGTLTPARSLGVIPWESAVLPVNIEDHGVSSTTASIFIWGAQLEVGSTATNYQRVSTQFDVTEAGVESLGYLSFDGIDDWMVTPTITPGSDKAQIFAGVRVIGTAFSRVSELSPSIATNSGSWTFFTNSTNGDYIANSRGTASNNVAQQAVSNKTTAPFSDVLAMTHDIVGDLTVLRRNGAVSGTATGNKGAGNFLAYPIYIGARAGTSEFLNGHLHQLITRFGANLELAQIENTEAYVAGKTAGVTL